MCKKCGCVVFDQNSEYCDTCNSEQKKNLFVYNSASRQLLKINTILKIVAFILLLVGFFCFIIGMSDYEDELIILEIIFFVTGLLTFIVRVFVNALIQITKAQNTTMHK